MRVLAIRVGNQQIQWTLMGSDAMQIYGPIILAISTMIGLEQAIVLFYLVFWQDEKDPLSLWQDILHTWGEKYLIAPIAVCFCIVDVIYLFIGAVCVTDFKEYFTIVCILFKFLNHFFRLCKKLLYTEQICILYRDK